MRGNITPKRQPRGMDERAFRKRLAELIDAYDVAMQKRDTQADHEQGWRAMLLACSSDQALRANEVLVLHVKNSGEREGKPAESTEVWDEDDD